MRGKALSGLSQPEREKLRKQFSDLLLWWPTVLAALHNYMVLSKCCHLISTHIDFDLIDSRWGLGFGTVLSAPDNSHV